MNKKSGYIRECILLVLCLFLIIAVTILGITLWKQQSQYDEEREQWEEEKKQYEKQLKKQDSAQAKKNEKAEKSEPAADAGTQYLENLDSSEPGEILDIRVLDMNHLSRYFRSYEIVEGDAVYRRINGKSYRENDDIGLDELSYMKMLHYNYDGQIQVGELIMNSLLAEDILDIFQELFLNQYQIQSMYLVDNYWQGDGIASDSASIDENNTSAFNYRQSTAGQELSNHAYGRAIDINPLQNPYIWLDEDGSPSEYYRDEKYIDREADDPHIIDHDDLCYKLFLEHGFTWGGDWINPVDYQHFEMRK